MQGLEVNDEVGAEADNSLTVFLRIFRNQVEEELVVVQSELVKSIRDLLMVQIMNKSTTKDKTALAALLEKKMAGSINEDEWTSVLQYLYNGSDSAAVGVIVKRLAVEFRAQKMPRQTVDGDGTAKVDEMTHSAATVFRSSNARLIGYPSPTFKNTILKGSLSPPPPPSSAFILRLPTPMFLKAVLDFQLYAHEQFLLPLSNAFHDVDKDHDGYILSKEFGKLIAKLRKGNGINIAAFDTLFPPKVSFSQAAAYYSKGKFLTSASK